MSTATTISGTLHLFVAFDWGDEIRLDQARTLASPASFQELQRRRRTPSSFAFRPPPLHVSLGTQRLDLPTLGPVEATAGVTLFDFAAVSVAFRMPFRLERDALSRLAGALVESGPLVAAARGLLAPLHRAILPAIQDPMWEDDLSEEYFVFQFGPETMPFAGDASWLAGLVHLESGPLSAEEASEALRLKLGYGPDDMFVADDAAAALFDRDCDETLQAVEFANLQLLEFRHIDRRLDDSLAQASRVVRPPGRAIWPFWRRQARPLRQLGELKVEANGLFERTGNVLKLIGDAYLARIYRLLASRFHLDAWEVGIQRKLEVAEGVYQVAADQAASLRAEFLELTIVVLILFEIAMAFVR